MAFWLSSEELTVGVEVLLVSSSTPLSPIAIFIRFGAAALLAVHVLLALTRPDVGSLGENLINYCLPGGARKVNDITTRSALGRIRLCRFSCVDSSCVDSCGVDLCQGRMKDFFAGLAPSGASNRVFFSTLQKVTLD